MKKTVQLAKEAYQTALDMTQNEISLLSAHISKGNAKVGDTDAFSLLPVFTCSAFAQATCGHCENGCCYALKSMIYPSARKAWMENTALAMHNVPQLFKQLVSHFQKMQQKNKLPRFFRLHVSGDFVSAEYLKMWCFIAEIFPQVTFYTYTKSF